MKEQEMPNQKGALEGLKEVCYVTDNQGNYTTALSEGWEVKDIAIESSMNLLQEQMQKAKELIQAGKQSPIVYWPVIWTSGNGLSKDMHALKYLLSSLKKH